ncbi:MAG: nitroreductase family protein [Promethearchaeota archaeon]
MQSFYAFVSKRRSIREYRDEPVSRDCIERIIQAGTWAPSAHDAQPWRFVVLEIPAAKRKLAEAMAAAYRRDLEQDGVSSHEVEEIVAESIERFAGAPILVLVCLTMEAMEVYPDEARQQAEHVMGVQSVAAAIQNMLLAIHAEGLGACWCCAPLFCPETVRAALELPSSYEPQALITLGYSAETPTPSERRLDSESLRYK